MKPQNNGPTVWHCNICPWCCAWMLEGEVLNHVLTAWRWDPLPSRPSAGVSEGRHWFLIPQTCPHCHLVPCGPSEGQDRALGQGPRPRSGPWGNGGGRRVPLVGDKTLNFLTVWRDTRLLWPFGTVRPAELPMSHIARLPKRFNYEPINLPHLLAS